MLIIVYVTLAFNIFVTQALDYSDCGSAYDLGSQIDVSGCPNPDDSCTIFIGQNTTISFSVDTGSTWDRIEDAANDVALYVRGTRFAVEVYPPNPCDVLPCPITANYNTTYQATVHVPVDYQPMPMYFKWVMTSNAVDDTLICFQFPVIVNV